jgi:hypothetical protein
MHTKCLLETLFEVIAKDIGYEDVGWISSIRIRSSACEPINEHIG